MTNSQELAIFFWVIAGIIIIVAIGMFLLFNKVTEGTLIRLREETDHGSHAKYYVPVYRYEVDGITYEKEGREYKRHGEMYEINSPCKVRYNPNNPVQCIVNNKVGFVGFAFIFIILGAIFFFI